MIAAAISFAAQTGPELAKTNLAAWYVELTKSGPPLWLTTEHVDQIAFIGGLLGVLIGMGMFIFPQSSSAPKNAPTPAKDRTAPDYDEWAKLSQLTLWEAACLWVRTLPDQDLPTQRQQVSLKRLQIAVASNQLKAAIPLGLLVSMGTAAALGAVEPPAAAISSLGSRDEGCRLRAAPR
jgi:hypothetical protein